MSAIVGKMSWVCVLSPAQMVSHRLRMNSFLNKWLLYLKQQNHRKDTWFPEVSTERSSKVKQFSDAKCLTQNSNLPIICTLTLVGL